jgi:hypothetical protein
MTDEEKNRKLLEFAGFTNIEKVWGDADNWGVYYALEPSKVYKDGRIKAPNFFDPELGLGWLFRYVVPKVWEEHKIKVILCRYDDSLYQATLVRGYAGHSEQDKQPQVALADAIVKWLEGQGK